jgi:hypothetical protein
MVLVVRKEGAVRCWGSLRIGDARVTAQAAL